MLGLPKWQIDAMFPVGGLLNAGQEASPERIEAIGGDPQGLLAPERPNGFWQGGEKIRGKDALAGLLAVISDTASQLGGNQGNAIEGLLGGRSSALDEFKKKAEQERKMQQTMALLQQAYPDLTDAQRMAMANNVGSYADFKPESNPMLRDVQAWQKMTPEEKAAASEMYATRSPWRVAGADGVPYQMNGAPDFLSDEDMAKLGGGTGNGAGGFRFR